MRPLARWAFITAAALLLATAVAGSDSSNVSGVTYYAYNWSEAGCAGPDRKTFLPYNKCASLASGPSSSGPASITYAPAVDAPVATIEVYADGNCTGKPGATTNIACGRCVHDNYDAAIGYYIWQCDVKAQYVTRQIQCNSDCSVCPPADIIGTTGCVTLPQGGGWGSVGVAAIAHGRWTEATMYQGDACNGTASTSWTQCGACLYGASFLKCG